MGYFVFSTILFCIVAGVTAGAHERLTYPKFLVKKSHYYDVAISARAGVPGMSSQEAVYLMNATMVVYAETAENLRILMRNVKTSVSEPGVKKDDGHIKMENSKELEDHLSLPIKCRFVKGKMISYTLHPKETLESQKIKRLALRNLELYLDEKVVKSQAIEHLPATYNRTRTSTYGNYTSHYVITSSPYEEFPKEINVYNISRTDNFEDMPYPAHKEHHNFDQKGCPEVCKEMRKENKIGAGCPLGYETHQDITKKSFVQRYNLVYLKNSWIVDTVETKETHIAEGLQVQTTIGMRFNKATLEQIAEPRGQYNFANLDDFSNEINEKGIPKLCGRTNSSELVKVAQTYLQEMAEIVVNADLSNKTTDLLGEQFSILLRALKTMKPIELRRVDETVVSYHHLPRATDIDQVKRQIWLDTMPLIGTPESVSFMTNLMQENLNKPKKEISLWEASSVLAQLAPNLEVISESVLFELRKLPEDISDKDEPGRMVFKSSAYFAIASTIFRACFQKGVNSQVEEPPKKTVVDEINLILQHLTAKKQSRTKITCSKAVVKSFIDDVTNKLSETEDSAERAIYVRTLATTGDHEALAALLPYIFGQNTDLQPSETDFLRVVAIESLHNLAAVIPRDIEHLVLPIYLNRTEPPKARMSAFSVFIKTNPSEGILRLIAEKTWEETSLEVGSFVTSTLDHYANSSLPCHQLISHRIKLVLPHCKKFEIGIQNSKHLLWNFFDKSREFGFEKQFKFVASNESIIPSILYTALSFHHQGVTDHPYEFAINSQGLRADVILDHLYKFLGWETADSIPKNKESEIFPKTKISPRDPEFWRVSMYRKMFYSVSYDYFDLREAQIGGNLYNFAIDYLNHYFRRDSKKGYSGWIVKLSMPFSSYKETIGQALPYPIRFNKENLMIFSMKINFNQENVKSSKKVKFSVEPSLFVSSRTSNEILNLRDCKSVGVYHTRKTAYSYAKEFELSQNGSGSFNLTYRSPKLPKQTFADHSETVTYAEKRSLTIPNDLAATKLRVPIETIPLRFQKNETRRFFGMPPVQTLTLTEDILEREEDSPKNWVESAIHLLDQHSPANFLQNLLYPGWSKKTINVTEIAVPDEWSANTTCSLLVTFNRHYSKPSTKPSRKLKDINDEIKRECLDKAMAVGNNTFWNEIEQSRETFKGDHTLDDIIKIKFQQKENQEVVSKADISFSYNRTLDGRMHDSELNITVETQDMPKPLEVSLTFTGLESDKTHTLKYNDNCGNNQRWLSLFKGEIGDDFAFSYKGISKRKSLSKNINEKLVSPILDEFLLPETHKTCEEDTKRGNGRSVPCIKAIRNRSVYNYNSGVITWRKKLPEIFNGLVKRAEVFLKTDFTEAILKAEDEDVSLPFNVSYIDVLTDKPVYEYILENGNQIIKKVVPALIPPPLSTTSLLDGFNLRATSNFYPATCSVMEKYVTTFDMVNYPLSEDVQMCPYVVATHCVKQKKFSVVAKFNAASPGSKEIHSYFGDDVVIIIPRNKTGLYTVKHNGQDHVIHPLMPAILNNKTLIFAYTLDEDTGILVLEARKAGIKLYYDGKNLSIQVSSKYKGELCGLCSDFNGETSKEFRGVDGCLYADSGDFAKSSTLGQCTDKTPSNAYICPGHKFSTGASEPNSQLEERNDFPNEEKQEDVNDEETKIVMRNKVLEKDDKLCISVEPLPFCEGEEQPIETEEMSVGFACHYKSESFSKDSFDEISQKILSELTPEDCEFTETVSVAKRC